MRKNINIWQVERDSRFLVSSADDIFKYEITKFPAFPLLLGGPFGEKEKVGVDAASLVSRTNDRGEPWKRSNMLGCNQGTNEEIN